MTAKTPTTSWMWSAGDDVNGVRIDTDRRTLEWMDGPGCACGDSLFSQPYADFLARGAKLDTMPADVLAEIRASVEVLQAETGA
ncbi:MAG TPA: hypothetical protein PKX07_22725 [Aggregatilineales bacterium]|jgi:hypothetical protein|nr:hypothetical protein [Aggregatilineales bacterium]